jgi:hypothetical protein
VAVAGVTRRLRLCPLVLNNDFHHPARCSARLPPGWGISYFSERDIDAFAPVIERLRPRRHGPGTRRR